MSDSTDTPTAKKPRTHNPTEKELADRAKTLREKLEATEKLLADKRRNKQKIEAKAERNRRKELLVLAGLTRVQELQDFALRTEGDAAKLEKLQTETTQKLQNLLRRKEYNRALTEKQEQKRDTDCALLAEFVKRALMGML